MSVLDCLTRLVKAGKISQRAADDAKAIHDGMLNGDLLRDMDAATADAYAALKTAEVLEQSAAAKKLELARRVTMFNQNVERINAHPDGPVAGFMALYDRDIRNRAGDRINVSAVKEDYLGQFAQKMHTFDEAYQPKAAGLSQDTKGIRDMIRESFGAKTGNQIAAKAAQEWKTATDWAVDKAAKLGRAFTPSDDWRIPQFWDTARVNKFGANEFKNDLQREISSGALVVMNKEEGRVATAAERNAIVDNAIKDIRMDMSKNSGPGVVFKDMQRTFQFVDGEKGAESYLRLMDKYGLGAGGYHAAMQAHVDKMAHELAMLHVLGPSPRAAGQALLDEARRTAAERALDAPPKNALDRLGDAMLRGIGLEGEVAAERLHKYMTGQLSGVGSETMAGIFQGARSWMTASNMGSAIVTALPTDSVNWLMAANHRGLNMGRLVSNVVDTFVADSADKAAAATRLGIVAHATSRSVIGTKQFGDELFGRNAIDRLADFVIRVQGVHAWDTGIKRAFTMEMLASIGERAGKSFDQIDPAFRSFLTDYGFTAADWNAMSAGRMTQAGAARFLEPESLEEGLRTKLMSAVYDERQFAYLGGGSTRVRAVATGDAKAGTVAGEFSRSLMLFKSFPMTMLATWGVRGAQEARAGRWSTAIQLGLFATMAGALALQARQIVTGKDPLDMKDGFFWAEAAFQGGGAGIYGDFLKEGFSRSGTSLTEASLGPLASIPAAAQRLTSGARRAAESGENVNFGAALADDIVKFTPGGNLWFSRLVFNRMIGDEIRRQLDPDYPKAFARAQKRALKDHNQEYFWAPGDSGPARGPNLGAMFGH